MEVFIFLLIFALKRFSLPFLGKVNYVVNRNYFNTLLIISECCIEILSSYVLCYTARNFTSTLFIKQFVVKLDLSHFVLMEFFYTYKKDLAFTYINFHLSDLVNFSSLLRSF